MSYRIPSDLLSLLKQELGIFIDPELKQRIILDNRNADKIFLCEGDFLAIKGFVVHIGNCLASGADEIYKFKMMREGRIIARHYLWNLGVRYG